MILITHAIIMKQKYVKNSTTKMRSSNLKTMFSEKRIYVYTCFFGTKEIWIYSTQFILSRNYLQSFFELKKLKYI